MYGFHQTRPRGEEDWTMKRACLSLMLGVSTILVVCGATLAAPHIEVDSADFDAGTITEGSKEKVTHTFKLKNVGDEPVKIKSVKPG
jgi:hypothetical protein